MALNAKGALRPKVPVGAEVLVGAKVPMRTKVAVGAQGQVPLRKVPLQEQLELQAQMALGAHVPVEA